MSIRRVGSSFAVCMGSQLKRRAINLIPKGRKEPVPAAAMEASDPSSRLTTTQREQLQVDQKVSEIFRYFDQLPPHTQSLMLEVWRDKHVEYLSKGIKNLGPSFFVLDANRPWLCYWILHSMALLGESLGPEGEEDVIDFLCRCQDPGGGYGGGPGQLPHLCTTYAAVNTLITLGGESALSSINRDKLHSFLLSMKQPSGAFSCQTYEGGIAGEPGTEAHGGYTFCGLATLILLNEAHRLDFPALIDWVTFRQGVECGFQGRTNKLVDGCYSFWQGGVLALIQKLSSSVEEHMRMLLVEGKLMNSNTSSVVTSLNGENNLTGTSYQFGQYVDVGLSFLEWPKSGPLFHSIALQHYILLCSQSLEGGFRDKPGKHRDFYHTCYCLSGLSVGQYSWIKEGNVESPLPSAVAGSYSNLLESIHPLFNIVLDKFYEAHDFFSSAT